jgi:hypothetical protein
MTADQRLNQIEPLVAQTLAVVDRHTAQLKQLVEFGMQQSDNITFLLGKVEEIDTRQQREHQEVSGQLQRIIDLLGNPGQ